MNFHQMVFETLFLRVKVENKPGLRYMSTQANYCNRHRKYSDLLTKLLCQCTLSKAPKVFTLICIYKFCCSTASLQVSTDCQRNYTRSSYHVDQQYPTGIPPMAIFKIQIRYASYAYLLTITQLNFIIRQVKFGFVTIKMYISQKLSEIHLLQACIVQNTSFTIFCFCIFFPK